MKYGFSKSDKQKVRNYSYSIIMKILFVSPYIPSPTRTRSFNFIRELSKKHKIYVVGLCLNDIDVKNVNLLKNYCQKVEAVNIPKWKSILNCIISIPTSLPLQVSYCYSKELLLKCNEIVKEGIDIIHVNLIRTAYIGNYLKYYPKVLDLVDLRSRYLKQVIQVSKNPIIKIITFEEILKLKIYEKKISKKFNIVMMNSFEDKNALKKLDNSINVQMLHTGIDFKYYSNYDIEMVKHRIIFVGRMSYYPNIEAVLFFCRYVFHFFNSHNSQ